MTIESRSRVLFTSKEFALTTFYDDDEDDDESEILTFKTFLVKIFFEKTFEKIN